MAPRWWDRNTLELRNLADNDVHFHPRITFSFLHLRPSPSNAPNSRLESVTLSQLIVQRVNFGQGPLDLRRDAITCGWPFVVAMFRVRSSASVKILIALALTLENVVDRSLLPPVVLCGALGYCGCQCTREKLSFLLFITCVPLPSAPFCNVNPDDISRWRNTFFLMSTHLT